MGSVSKHYIGDRGVEYARGQQDIGYHIGYAIQSRFYIPYLCKDDIILDFGCANGGITNQLRKHVNEIYGLEVNDYTRKIAERNGLKVFKSLSEIPVALKFDKIVSNHVLEHIPNVFETIEVLRSKLKPGGSLITVLPIDDFRTSKNREWKENDKDNHLFTWTPMLFGNLLVEAGFLPIQLKIFTTAWSPKMFFLKDTAILRIANWLTAILKRKRQLFALAKVNISR